MKIIDLSSERNNLAYMHGFAYVLSFNPTVEDFKVLVNIRNWLWDTFGPSAEIAILSNVYSRDKFPAWSFVVDKSTRHIILGSEAYMLFCLNRENLVT
jgi:hypothetical protein